MKSVTICLAIFYFSLSSYVREDWAPLNSEIALRSHFNVQYKTNEFLGKGLENPPNL